MENASKALIIAGSILIALMIIGAVILMFNSLSNYQNMNDKDVKEAQIVKFNNQYETYNRDNVRGSDLYSLLNRVADYNRRKSEVGVNNGDEGIDSQFQPMSVTVSFINENNLKKLVYKGGESQLFKSILGNNNYTFKITQATSNTFEERIYAEISNLENDSRFKGKKAIENLASGISNLDTASIDSDSSGKAKLKAVDLYINNVNDSDDRKKIENEIKSKISSIINAVNKYYEFIQFKRAYFNCTHTDYNPNTGRIVNMTFEFNGRFE